VQAVLAAGVDAPLSYPHVGATRGELPQGWCPHVVRGAVGRGAGDFEAACQAIRAWTPFDLGWVDVIDRQAPLAEGQVVGFVSRQLGVCVINLCRVVYVVDERDSEGDVLRFGFAYGTLPDHAVRGEELFVAEWDRSTDQVWFQVRKFSRPGRRWAALMGPISRAIQARFSRDALERVQLAVRDAR